MGSEALDSDATPSTIEGFRAQRERIRTEMGGADKVERLHQRGQRTVRERIDELLDPDTLPGDRHLLPLQAGRGPRRHAR